MNLTDEQIVKFQSLYKTQFLVDLSVDEAKERGLMLVNFVKILKESRRLYKAKNEDVNEDDKVRSAKNL